MNDMQPDTGVSQGGDREGAMAKADLHKLANYSIKLFKKIGDDDELESWVQAKITKAADYIASVYHYMEYEMKFSEYGEHLSNAEIYNESTKVAIANKLMEAKEKVKELKKLQAEKKKKVEEGKKKCTCEKNEDTCAVHGKVDEGFDTDSKVGDTFKTKTGVATKTKTGVVHKNTSFKDEGDEIASNAKSGKGTKSHAKSMSAAEKKDRAPALKKSKTGTWGMEGGEKFDNRKTNESAKPDFADLDKDGDEKEPMKKAAKEAKKEKKVDEAKKKSPKAKKDYDKDGKIESEKDEVIGSRRKAAGLDESAVEAWKYQAQRLKESMAPQLVQEEEANLQKIIAIAAEKDPAGLKAAGEAGPDAIFKYLQSVIQTGHAPSNEAFAEDTAVESEELALNESTDMTRMKEFLTRLNG